jgi:hypothetical protein
VTVPKDQLKAVETFDDLASMIRYFQSQEAKIERLVKEIDEINQGITTALVEAQDGVENAVSSAVMVADDAREQLAPWLRQVLDAGLPAMRDVKGSRRVELEKTLSDLYGQRAQIEKQEQDELDKLAQTNPTLNAREEELKKQAAEVEASVAQTEAALRQAAGGLGWLVSFGRIRGLRHQHQRQATALYGLRERLSEVRNNWAKDEAAAKELQDRLQQAWRLRTMDIAKLSQESDSLTSDFEGVCRRQVFEDLFRKQESFEPTGLAGLDDALRVLDQWRERAADCEGGVVAVSEILGLLKGMKEGLERMRSSIESVKKEQDMHSELSDLRLKAPPALLQFHQIWDALLPTVLDEKQSVAHPKELADIIHQVTGTRLTDKNIEAMFNLAGDVLTKATKEQWD